MKMKMKAVVEEQISEADLLEYEQERELDKQEMHNAIMAHKAEDETSHSNKIWCKSLYLRRVL